MITAARSGGGSVDLNEAQTRRQIIDRKLALAGRQVGDQDCGALSSSLSQRAFRGEL